MEIVGMDQISPDQVIFWTWGFVTINATLVYTWFVMAILVAGSWWITRRISRDLTIPRWQNFLEVVVSGIRGEIREIVPERADYYLPFIGTLFL
ncbi:MAG: F0F1 ATP synthase subunit A, partial [Syntrophales bacterium]